MNYDDLAALIKGRRSIRAWQPQPVPAADLLKAVELATWAPNGGNQQNWRFYVITNPATIGAIGDAVQQSANQIASWAEATELMGAASGWAERAAFFRSAPAGIAIAASVYQSPVDVVLAAREQADPRAAQMRQWRNIADSRIQSAASAIAYLLLILHQMGLGAVWMTGPMQAKEQLEKILGVAPGFDLVAYIPVGYPAESPESKGRRPVAEVCEVIE